MSAGIIKADRQWVKAWRINITHNPAALRDEPLRTRWRKMNGIFIVTGKHVYFLEFWRRTYTKKFFTNWSKR